MKIVAVVSIVFLAALCVAQSKSDEEAIRKILAEEVTTWNQGDADGYSRHFASDLTFTNIQGMFFKGHVAFRDRHEDIFKGLFRGTVLKQEVVSLRLIRPDVAVVETLTWIKGFPKAGPPPDTHLDRQDRLRTRLLQVFVKEDGEWKIIVYHNVDVKPRVSTPEPQ